MVTIAVGEDMETCPGHNFRLKYIFGNPDVDTGCELGCSGRHETGQVGLFELPGKAEAST